MNDSIKNFIYFAKKLSTNKAIEFQFGWGGNRCLSFSLNLAYTSKEDHAGFKFDIALGKLFLDISIYDMRHWNEMEKRWYRDDEEIFSMLNTSRVFEETDTNILDIDHKDLFKHINKE